jgi:hypothetical protein
VARKPRRPRDVPTRDHPIPTIVGPMPVIVKAKRSKSTEPEFSDEERQRGQEMLDKLMADPRRAARGE